MKKQLLESILAAPGYVVCSLDAMPPPETPAEDFIREVVFYSGAKVERFDWWTGETYDLSFSMTGADLSALNGGASPVLNGHESEEAEDVIGVIVSASKDKRGYVATLRFSNREDVAGIRQDIADGILRNVSMGVSIQALELVSKPEEKRKHYMATAWKPFEISVVPIGADPGAKFLSKDARLERLRSLDISAPTGAASEADDSEQKARLALQIKQRRFRVLGR